VIGFVDWLVKCAMQNISDFNQGVSGLESRVIPHSPSKALISLS